MKKIAFWGGILALILILTWGYFYFDSTPSETAEKAADSTSKVDVFEADNALIFEPKESAESESIILYPGAFIDALSYAPLAKELANAGYKTYVVEMPFNLAVFGKDRAEPIIKENSDEHFVIGGHSLGGVMAARFANEHQNEIDGVFFLASYPDKKGDLKSAGMPVLSITATNDQVLNQDKYQESKKYLPANDTTYVSIKGGNHAGFGSYGKQNGDGERTISASSQTDQTANSMISWLQTSVQNEK
ncbi:alpha/beta hydrolase [Listeria costaricensis]|uniref:alpha/beta hydrolase n=1 Tax=Listeria costaricensis TaxID=2026604 RepID=UPI000C075703|nr:alpha/beta hydrolase [Listeria costaricensis]